MYVDDFFLASNTMTILKTLKKLLAKKYKIKDLGEVKIIIGWQITRNIAICIIKIDQLAFIRNLIIKEKLTEFNHLNEGQINNQDH